MTEGELETTSVVANRQMNRERELRGGNGYSRDLGFDAVSWLASRESPSWLDMCCGTGRALLQANAELGATCHIVGVDLVDFFWSGAQQSGISFVVSPVRHFAPAERFNLITCVHGLHYVGDKLGALRHLRSLLKPGGLFVAHLDLNHVLINDVARPRWTARLLREAGFSWNARRHLISASFDSSQPLGPRQSASSSSSSWPVFLGARLAGPNYTGQPAVESCYSRSELVRLGTKK